MQLSHRRTHRPSHKKLQRVCALCCWNQDSRRCLLGVLTQMHWHASEIFASLSAKERTCFSKGHKRVRKCHRSSQSQSHSSSSQFLYRRLFEQNEQARSTTLEQNETGKASKSSASSHTSTRLCMRRNSESELQKTKQQNAPTAAQIPKKQIVAPIVRFLDSFYVTQFYFAAEKSSSSVIHRIQQKLSQHEPMKQHSATGV